VDRGRPDQRGGNDTIDGGAGNDVVTDQNGNDTIDGGAGDDTLTDNGGTNLLRGGDGADTITFYYAGTNTVEGGAGDDLLRISTTAYNNAAYANTLSGGPGNDRLVSGGSADTYLFDRGDGQDTINDYDNWSNGKTDSLVFGAGTNQDEAVLSDQLWFRRIGNNLEIDVIGTSDSVLIENWYAGSAYHVEQFRTADGKMLPDTRVDNLVSAMSNLALPALGQTTLPQDYLDTLGPILAANWG
jgi:Ca2+-binding RTX toxin-like protein